MKLLDGMLKFDRRRTLEPVSRTALQLVIEGDMAAFNELTAAPWQEVERLAKDDALILSGEAVARVLHRLQRREITGKEAQRWASFVRRGYLPTARAGP